MGLITTKFPLPIGMNDVITLSAAFPGEKSVTDELLELRGWKDRAANVRFKEKSAAIRTMRDVSW